MKNKVDGYKELICIIDDYKLGDMQFAKRAAEKHVFVDEFRDKYHIVVNAEHLSIDNGFWINVPVRLGNMYIGLFGEKYNRDVLNNTQDTDEEILLTIQFHTGAFVFGEDYPTEFFEKFYAEIKTYKPKYCDDLNKSMYFSMENAANIFEDYRGICDKYIKENRNDLLQRRAEQLRKEATQIEEKLANEITKQD